MNTIRTTTTLALCLTLTLLGSACAKPAPEADAPSAAEAAKTPAPEAEKKAPAEAKKAPAPEPATKPTAKTPPPKVAKAPGHSVRKAPTALTPIPKDAVEVEASCGQCQFGLTEPRGCDLAVRINGKAHFVDGSHIDDHGDAHARRGMCNTVRRAAVTGEVVDNRFVAKTFRVID
jgi:hypothetical protein